MAINAVATNVVPPTTLPSDRTSGAGAGKREAGGFIDALGRLVTSAEQAGNDANSAVTGMIDGSTDVHETMIALQRADISLQLTVQVRNKLVQAYQEIMRMPV